MHQSLEPAKRNAKDNVTKTRDRFAGRHDHTFAQSFRFLDLPAEIRNCIYSFILASRTTRDISYFRIPVITLVSKQTRQEALPILFAESNFRIITFCAPKHAYEITTLGLMASRYGGEADPPTVFPTTEKYIRTAGDAALFGDVTFQIHRRPQSDAVQSLQREAAISGIWEVENEQPPFLRLHIRLVNRQIKTCAEKCDDHPDNNPFPFTPNFTTLNIDAMVESAEAVARRMGGVDGFKGFTLNELKIIGSRLGSLRDIKEWSEARRSTF